MSLSESLDTATPAGRMVFTVLGAVAELERSLIVELVKAGQRNARAKGKRLGRPKDSSAGNPPNAEHNLAFRPVSLRTPVAAPNRDTTTTGD